jgi:hypothetical protein
VEVSSVPFVLAQSGEPFLNQDRLCIDSGDNAVATSTYGANGWNSLTTGIDGNPLDTGVVDMGAHYDPNGSWILTFEADAINVTWTTHGLSDGSCVVTADGWEHEVVDGQRANGTVAHTQATDVEITIACTNAAGKMSFATVSVP